MNAILRLEITDLCNLHCNMCWSKKWDRAEMKWDNLKVLLCDFAQMGGKCVVLTSREPLMSKNIVNVLNLCSDLSLDIKLLTNGTLITDEIAKVLVECRALSYIAISLHGKEQRHDLTVGVTGSYIKVIAALTNIEKYMAMTLRSDLIVRLTTIVSEALFSDISSVVEVAMRFDVGLRVQHYMWYPDFIARKHRKAIDSWFATKDTTIDGFPSKCDIGPEHIKQLVINVKQLCLRNGVELQMYPELDNNDIQEWYSKSPVLYENYVKSKFNYCEHAKNSIRVRANGDVVFCQYIDTVFGNTSSTSLLQIISNAELNRKRDDVQNGVLFPICYHCCHVSKVVRSHLPTSIAEI